MTLVGYIGTEDSNPQNLLALFFTILQESEALF